MNFSCYNPSENKFSKIETKETLTRLCKDRDSEIAKTFFSQGNVKRIQKMIKKEVFNKTNGKYKLAEDQDENDLMVTMKHIYDEKCRNLPGQIVRQVKELNQELLDFVIPDILSNIKHYYFYIEQINKPIEPMTRPMNDNNAGRKTLPSVTTLWQK